MAEAPRKIDTYDDIAQRAPTRRGKLPTVTTDVVRVPAAVRVPYARVIAPQEPPSVSSVPPRVARGTQPTLQLPRTASEFDGVVLGLCLKFFLEGAAEGAGLVTAEPSRQAAALRRIRHPAVRSQLEERFRVLWRQRGGEGR